MENGKVFIADELNLADQMIIQSLNVAIEPSKNDEIIMSLTNINFLLAAKMIFQFNVYN